MNTRRGFVLDAARIALAAGFAGSVPAVRADVTTRLLVGFPPGATGDRIARAVSPPLAAALGNTVIVENRAGAAGQIVIEAVTNGPADGALLLQTIGSSMVIYPHTYKGLRYRPFDDFVPIGTAATVPIVFVAAKNVPATTTVDALALARRDANFGVYGSPAAGSVFHFSGVLLQRALQTRFDHVPYKGSAPLLQDVLAGQVPFGFMAQSDVLEHHRAGALRILAVTGTSRTTQLPDVPTFPELGYSRLVNREWFSYFLSSQTPAPVVSRYRAAIQKVVTSAEVRGKFLQAGLEVADGDPTALAEAMTREYAQWEQIVKEIGFVAD